MVTVEQIKGQVLKPYLNRKQLSLKESELISLELIDLLSESSCDDDQTLKYVGRFLTKDAYQDLSEERNLNKKCVYPRCELQQGRLRDLYGGNNTATRFLKENNPYAYLTFFCSKFHYRCSQFFQAQLSDEALFARTGVLQDEYDQDDQKITLLNELISNERHDKNELVNIIKGFESMHLTSPSKTSDKELEEDLSEWLADIKIQEVEKPAPWGDLGVRGET
ncbi:LAMI_0H12596g1_1 [Lachancea mirantina]|uniref:RNA polymerase II subunit B1 CTD phosphatase RPAP2 homolog n=1 Tax=Lachancea mirantina TaxID=1230905 RepID=A0A1G4KHM9_9SACH|nr:LAMI_0H12596g1_1 [Lachancea mirantina]